MKIESQVVSLELAKKLKELGVKQESLFAWHQALSSNIDTGEVIESDEWGVCLNPESGRTRDDKYGRKRWPAFSAFTVAELGEMLPAETGWSVWKNPNPRLGVKNELWKGGCDASTRVFYADTEANARAVMLVHFLENKLITL